MRRTHVLIFLTLFALISCDKNKYTTKPQITIKSVSPDEMTRDHILSIVLEFTDKEGDITDSMYFVKQILNENQKGTFQEFLISRIKLPIYPKAIQGEMEIRLARKIGFGVPLMGDPLTAQNDTVLFHMAVKDAAGNWSDTVTTANPIVIIR